MLVAFVPVPVVVVALVRAPILSRLISMMCPAPVSALGGIHAAAAKGPKSGASASQVLLGESGAISARGSIRKRPRCSFESLSDTWRKSVVAVDAIVTKRVRAVGFEGGTGSMLPGLQFSLTSFVTIRS